MRITLFTSLMIAATLMFACKRATVTSTSSLRDSEATTEPAVSEKGACVVYHRETKKVQATCFGERTPKECDDSFKKVYEDAAPGKYVKEFIAKTSCEAGKKQVEENLNDGAAGSNSGNSKIPGNTKCVCAAFVQQKADKRHCLVARRKSSATDAAWEAVAELTGDSDSDSDCEKQCGLASGAAATALKSATCLD